MRMVDVHAHILPGVDDGSRNMEETLTMLQKVYEDGVRHVIATPHFRFLKDHDAYQKEYEKLRKLCRTVEQTAKEASIKMEISLGQEIFYFEELTDYLNGREALTMADSRYVLIEFASSVSFATIERAVYKLGRESYIPMLAHIERYECLRKPGRIPKLIEDGAVLQMNCDSLFGNWLDRSARWCRKQVLSGRIQFLGTDMHRATGRRAPRYGEVLTWLRKKDIALARKITREDPASLLADELLEHG